MAATSAANGEISASRAAGARSNSVSSYEDTGACAIPALTRKRSENGPRHVQPAGNQRELLTGQLERETYECMVCCDKVRRRHYVWSCDECSHVFHLRCIQEWARSDAARVDQGWRCPTCSTTHQKTPAQYFCFCGAYRQPPEVKFVCPHSCGEPCRRQRSCRHKCPLLCHPGPCPPCAATVTARCSCGRESRRLKCGEGFSCARVCGTKLECGEHTCEQSCHRPSCGECSLMRCVQCYCASESKEVRCGSDEREFQCGGVCGRKISCGLHFCGQHCHAGACEECGLMPEVVKTCPCGKKTLAQLGVLQRIDCLAEVPVCGSPCGGEMKCGHRCAALCHGGECRPCSEQVTSQCVCGKQTFTKPCLEWEGGVRCAFRCNKKMSCGRHKCTEVCCKQDDHLCMSVCARQLSCGKHHCEELCHKGVCAKCFNVGYDELRCHCGMQVTYPPIQCGQTIPKCEFMCTRPHPCSHQVYHECHPDAEPCPACTYPVSRLCAGGHMLMENVPCYITEPGCGYPCGRALGCGHKCPRNCHGGDCNQACVQPCSRTRRTCGHACSHKCHAGSSCPESPCRAKLHLSCECGSRKRDSFCHEVVEEFGASVYADQAKSALLNSTSALLTCDSRCKQLARNVVLSEALGNTMNPEPQTVFTPFLVNYARSHKEFARNVEAKLRELVSAVKTAEKKMHSFEPMNREQRRFVHELAEFFGCDGYAYDPEPKRNVVVYAYKGRSRTPNNSLQDVSITMPLPFGPAAVAAPEPARPRSALPKPSEFVHDLDAFMAATARKPKKNGRMMSAARASEALAASIAAPNFVQGGRFDKFNEMDA